MPTLEERTDLWGKLWDKKAALNDWEREFNSRVPIDERPNFEGLLRSVQSEKEQLTADMRHLLEDEPLPFPSPEAIAALQVATGQLTLAVRTSAQFNQLLQALTAVLRTWPVSGAG